MIDYKHSDLFLKGSADKQWKIEYDGGVITNKSLFSQSIEITESLCSGDALRFGSCEAGVLKFKMGNVVQPLLGKWLSVSVILDRNEGDPFFVGRYKVASDKATSDRLHREVVAYDAMHEIINASVVDWYNEVLPNESSWISMRQFRTSFLENFGIEQEETTLANDGMIVRKTIQVGEGVEIDDETERLSVLRESSLSGLDVIRAICEINGCFGHIGRDGKFHYIYLEQAIEGLYPSENLFPGRAPEHMVQSKTGSLYPQEPKGIKIGRKSYMECHWEDFYTKRITKLQIRQEENDIGKIWPEGQASQEDNCYIIENNFLVYGKTEGELRLIAKSVFERITDIVYRPFDAEAVGNPCLEVGDPVTIPTKHEIVESYVLSRTLKGLQGLRDEYRSSGVLKYGEKTNGVHSSIIQLSSKANVLKRTIEETRSELINSDEGLRSEILQTAGEIRTEVQNAKEGLETSILQTADRIAQEVHDRGESEKELYSRIEQEAGRITQEISERKDGEDILSSKIEQTAGSITQTIAGSERMWNSKFEKEDGTTEEITVDLYEYGDPRMQGHSYFFIDEEEYRYGMKYLDQKSGKVWMATGNRPNEKPPRTVWSFYRQLELITSSLESRIEQTITGVSMEVENGEKSAGIAITLESEDGTTENIRGTIEMNGLVTFKNLTGEEGETKINGALLETGTVNCDTLNGGSINGQVITGGNITGTDIEANSFSAYSAISMQYAKDHPRIPVLILGTATVPATLQLGSPGGGISDFHVYPSVQFHEEAFFNKNIHGERVLYLDKNDGKRGVSTFASDGATHFMIDVEEDSGTTMVGLPSMSKDSEKTTTRLRGNSVVLHSSGAAVTSDERVKNSFKPLDEFDAVYMDIEPCAFKYNNGNSGRYHFGVKAGSVKEAFEKHGYTTKDFGGFVQMSDNPENEEYCGVDDPMGIIYTEFVMWNMRKNQMQQREIDGLKKEIIFLRDKLNEQDEEIGKLEAITDGLLKMIQKEGG